ncbi:MAG: beta-ketoacyl-ACP synthase II, partial [Deltaproteobacteria bacterium]
MRKRVVVTGLGVVSAVGIGVSEFWGAVVQGREGAKEITVFNAAPYRTKIAA